MAGGRRGSLSESISDPDDIESELKGFDDLDDELFGVSLHKTQPSIPKSKAKENSLPKSKSNYKTSVFKEFDDDPLTGLLSDEDELSEKKFAKRKSEQTRQEKKSSAESERTSKSTVKNSNKAPVPDGGDDVMSLQQVAQGGTQKITQQFNDSPVSPIKGKTIDRRKVKDVDFDDSFDLLGGLGLDDNAAHKSKKVTAPLSPVKGRSFMDDLLGREEKKPKEKKSEFVLVGNYKNITKDKEGDDAQFGSYVPSSVADDKSPEKRTVRFGDDPEMSRTTGQGFSIRSQDSDGTIGGILSNKRRRDSQSTVSKVKESVKDDDKADFAIRAEKETATGEKSKSYSEWLGLGETFSAVDKTSGKDLPLDWLDSNDKRKDIKKANESSGILETPSHSQTDKVNVLNPSKDSESDWLALKEKFTSRTKHSTSSVAADVGITKPSKLLKETKPEAPAIPNLPDVNPLESHSQTSSVTNQMMTLQGVLAGLNAERSQLLQSIETIQNRHQEELKSVENFHQLQMKSLQESCQQREKRLMEDYELKTKELESKVHNLGTEKMDLVTNYQQKLEKQEFERRQEVQRLKEIHCQAIASLKQEHEDALGRLRHLKDQEVEAISSTQVYTRSLQSLTDQLEARAVELSALQQKVDEKHQKALQDRQALLEAKDKELKAQETRLQKQLADAEEERSHLQQLILRLENRLQQQTKDLEEERWQLKQQTARLEVQQRTLMEEKKQMDEQMMKEREKLQRIKDTVMQEQKTVLLQLAQDRQKIEVDRSEMELVLTKRLEEESRINSKRFQEEANYESQRRTLQQEKDKIQRDREQLRQEQSWIQQERESLLQEHRQIQEEKEKLQDLGLQLKRRSEEVEEMCLSASQAREEGKLALQAARQIEMEQKKQSGQVVNQLQAAFEKERQLLQERETLAVERRNLEMKRDNLLCASCHLSLNHPIPVLPAPVMVSQKLRTVADDHSQLLSLVKDPTMLVWQITAKKDKEFLEEEGSFLHSLKRSNPGTQELKEMG